MTGVKMAPQTVVSINLFTMVTQNVDAEDDFVQKETDRFVDTDSTLRYYCILPYLFFILAREFRGDPRLLQHFFQVRFAER